MSDRMLIQNLTSLVALRNTQLEKLQAAQADTEKILATFNAQLDKFREDSAASEACGARTGIGLRSFGMGTALACFASSALT